MPRDARFWRNVAIIAVAHIVVVIALVRWSLETRKPNLQSIVWLSGGGSEVAARSAPGRTEPEIETTPPPEADTPPSKPEEKDEPPVPTSARSNIQLPIATPTPSPIPKPLPKLSVPPIPKASVRPTAKPTPKSPPRKSAEAKATPKPLPKKSATPAEQKKANEEAKKESVKIAPANANGTQGPDSGSTETTGTARSAEFSWYGKMLHDRFYSEWVQPTTSVAVGAKMSALVRIRIEKDGRVSKFTLVRPSGNVVLDESVAAVAKKVTQVDPLPKGLAGGAFYEVNINFELNPEQ
jgi:TonB family protein